MRDLPRARCHPHRGGGQPLSQAETRGEADVQEEARRQREIIGAAGALTVAVGHEINEDAKVTPFPSFAGHAQKALAQNRRDSLLDAEQTARADRVVDRWWTVLFHLRELDSRNDPEACFWRVVAYYRLGELARARALRGLCEPPASVQTMLDNEDALSSTLQPVAALPEMAAAGEKAPTPVINSDPYAGPAFPR